MVRAVAHAMANAEIRTVGAMRRVTRVEVDIVDEGEGEERLDRLEVVDGAGTRDAGVADALSTEWVVLFARVAVSTVGMGGVLVLETGGILVSVLGDVPAPRPPRPPRPPRSPRPPRPPLAGGGMWNRTVRGSDAGVYGAVTSVVVAERSSTPCATTP